MRISIIVATSANNVIGADGWLPWHLPEDLRKFKQITMGKPMIMGRATWDSIGRALPGRRSIVLTRKPGFEAPGAEVVGSVDEALAVVGDVDEVMIIGGGEIYRQFLPMTDRVYLTRLEAEIEGDTRFPELDMEQWQVVSAEEFPAVNDREFAFTIEVLDRRADSTGPGDIT